ncbi:MAG TPA: hypothetical protein VG318_11935 [Actinomycetota bacterium]|nr:hypothetical protein [Actinomycetota bacterium]
MAKRVLVVANRTVGGRKLLEAVKARAEKGDVEFHLVVPLTRPRHGDVIYDHAQRDAAQLRIQLSHDFLKSMGISITGEVGDEDPFTATLDAVATYAPDEIIVSTLPETRSGWLRRDLVDRIRDETDLPVEHLVTDVESEGLAVGVTLVVANRTSGGQELIDVLKEQASADDKRVFVCVIPQEGGEGHAAHVARERLGRLLRTLRSNGILASGMIGDPDPYDATLNALDLFTVDKVVISTLPGEKSGWLRNDLIERVRGATTASVEHVEVDVSETANV